jgi:DNA-binding PadR family transcriptional regulator
MVHRRNRSRHWFGDRHELRDEDAGKRMAMDGGRGRHRGRGRHGGGQLGIGDHGTPFGPFGPFDRGGIFGHRPRVGRGDVRTAVLRLLAEEPRNGYQIIQELTERSGGAWRPSPGSIYPALQQLEDEGLIRAEERDGKRVFRLTEAGQSAAATLGAAAAPWDAASDRIGETELDLRQLIGQVATALIQVAQAGNESQLARAKEVMTNARRSLYRILAEDDEVTVL